MWARAARRVAASASAAGATARARVAAASPRTTRVAVGAAAAATVAVACSVTAASPSASASPVTSWLQSTLGGLLSLPRVSCAAASDSSSSADDASGAADDDDEHHKHTVVTKTFMYYSGPGGELSNMRLFSGNSNRALATEIARYLGLRLSDATVGHFADGECKIQEMGVDRVVAVDLHGGQIQGFFSPSVPVENLESMPIGALYFSEKHLRKPVVVAASAGGVLRAKRFRETLVEQGIETDMAMLIEAREADDAGRFEEDAVGKLDLVGNVKGCDCILIEDIVDTATTMQHAAFELKRQGSRHVYAFATHAIFSSPESAQKIEQSPIRELVVTNTVRLRPSAERVEKITQLTLAPLLAESIRRIYQKRSISGLYTSPIAAPASSTEVKAP